MNPFAWNGIHCKLPNDWELLQFSKNPGRGRVVCGDRYQLRCEIDWTQVEKPPELERMIQDYQAKLAADGIRQPRIVNHHPWRGVTGIEDGMRLTRYCNYASARCFLLEAVFLWPEEQSGKHNHQFEATILDSFKVMPNMDDGMQEWNAFHIHCHAPDRHQLTNCTANPANVIMMFADDKGAETETVRRIGCLDVWLKEGVNEWIKSLMPKDFKVLSMNCTAQEEHQIWTLEATVARPVLKDWMKGRRNFTAAAWICPHDKRLYAVTKLAHQYRDGHQPLPIALTCCPQLEITL